MSEHAEAHGNKANFIVWIVLLALTLVEVILAYIHLDQMLMLILLMGFSIIKAVLIIAFFMHMKFERLSFILTMVPATVLTISLICVIYPEGYRVLKFLPEAEKKAAEHGPAEAGHGDGNKDAHDSDH